MNKDFVIKNTGNYDEWLIEQLKDPEEALVYLEVALEAFRADNDVIALKCAALNVIHAQYYSLKLTNLTGIDLGIFEQSQNITSNPKSSNSPPNLSSLDLVICSWGLGKRDKAAVQYVDHIPSGGLVDIGVTYE